MNIDYLHQQAGSRRVYEYWNNHCARCHAGYNWQLAKNETVPHCRQCGAPIIPDFVLRNLATYPDQVAQGEALIKQADLLIIVGTKRSSSSFPSATPKIVINIAPEYLAGRRTTLIRGRADEVFKMLVAA
jgi:NAD-dependent deacetylase